ncbi:hypothetical protein ALC57_09633, partial [Trachymyrmex cornetzi]
REGAVTTGPRDPPKVRPPKAAAVAITCPPGTYPDIMRGAREKIHLGEIVINDLRTRRGVTSSLVLEVPGPDSPAKADALAEKLAEALRDKEGMTVSRPRIAEEGGCTVNLVRVGIVRVTRDGMGSIWARCSVTTAKKIAANGRLTIG